MAQDYSKILNKPEVIAWSKKYLRKRNRIEWYLKIVRESPSVHPCEELKHYYLMKISEIEIYLPQTDLSEVLFDLKNIEKDYLDKQLSNCSLISPSKKESIFLECQDGYFWVNLNVSYSPEEGKAMGHCGNRGAKKNDTILSLRKKIIKGLESFWEPHLTFILNKGILGERKGKQNDKPQGKYHPQILKLLVDPRIQGIASNTGYLPQHNFMYGDLSEVDKNYLLEKYSAKITKSQKKVLENFRNVEFIINCKNKEESQELKNYDMSWIKETNDVLDLYNKTKHLDVKKVLLGQIEGFEDIEKILEGESLLKNDKLKIASQESYSDLFKKTELSEEQKLKILKLTYGNCGTLWSSTFRKLPKSLKYNYIQEVFLKESSKFFNNKLILLIYNEINPLENEFWVELMRKYPKYRKEVIPRIFGLMKYDSAEEKDNFVFKILTFEERQILFNQIKDLKYYSYFLSKETDSSLKELLIEKACKFNVFKMIDVNNKWIFRFKESHSYEILLEQDLKERDLKIEGLVNIVNFLKNISSFGSRDLQIKELEKKITILKGWNIAEYSPKHILYLNKFQRGISTLKNIFKSV